MQYIVYDWTHKEVIVLRKLIDNQEKVDKARKIQISVLEKLVKDQNLVDINRDVQLANRKKWVYTVEERLAKLGHSSAIEIERMGL